MKNYEKESLFKNFFVFFSLLEILLILLFIELYHAKENEYKHRLLQDMRVCSYSLDCKQFSFDFAAKENNILNKLYDKNTTYGYFSIPKSKKYYMKISYASSKLQSDIEEIIQTMILQFVLVSFLLFAVALFFTLYSLNPIRKALRLNDEFIKDILHDFNTPITSMILNIKMFKEDKGEDLYVYRVSKSIDTILILQNNLRSFLYNSPTRAEIVNITKLVEERLSIMQNIYPKIHFVLDKRAMLSKITNYDLLIRIFDNLFSNAAKYNRPKGKVKLSISNDIISIEDTGKGIKNIKKVFYRYYKEQDRGLGLGLHIVKKLCDELHIIIAIESKVGFGTKVILDFKELRKVS